jgi:hypothetical protein
MKNRDDPFGVLLSALFPGGNMKINGYLVIEKLLELDRSGKLTKKERNLLIPPEYRHRKNNGKGGV